MPSTKVMDRLNNGNVLLLDGGLGSELDRRGFKVVARRPDAELHAWSWSATANLEDPDLVQQVHQDYLRVGADIIMSNNFWTNRTRMEAANAPRPWEEYARAAADIAVRARDKMNPDAYVAAAFAPPGINSAYRYGVESDYTGEPSVSDLESIGEERLRENFEVQAKLAAEAGVDIILAEFMIFVEDAVIAVEACASVDLPVWLALRSINLDGTMASGESYQDLVSALEGYRVDGILLMCTWPEEVSAGLPELRRVYDGPIGAYPNVGYTTNEFAGRPQYTPPRLAEFAGEWKQMGAQIIGGCCGTGPEHIKAMHSAINGD